MKTVIVDELNLRELIESGVRFAADRIPVGFSYKWLLTTYA